MPISYRIDPLKGVIVVTAQGVVTIGELLEAIEASVRDPEFRSDLRCLNDFSKATELILTASNLECLAEARTLAPKSRRALIATGALVFGMGRMYEAYVDMNNQGSIRVFSDRAAAVVWLNEGVPADKVFT